MALTELTSDNLGDLGNGAARGIINAGLNAVISDLDERGSDEQKRELTVKLTFLKKKGVLAVDCQAIPKMPAYRTDATIGNLDVKVAKGRAPRSVLTFQPHNAENPDQSTIYDNERIAEQL